MPHYKVSATYQSPMTQVVEAKTEDEAVDLALSKPNDWVKEKSPDDHVNWSYRVDLVN